MPGMNSGLNAADPTVVAAFRAALLHQGLIALAIFAVLSIVWVAVRDRTANAASAAPQTAHPEPAGHQLLRIGFGLLWLFDGLLQAQPKMAAGLPSQVIEPIAATSPHWVQHLVNWAGTTWSYHPIQAGAASVWIQVGIGLWLLAAPRGLSGRLAGLVSVVWGLIVWVFGESFGGIFAPGLTWLFGAPGAVLIYAVAGALLVLPDRSWQTPKLGRALLAGFGLFLIGMAVLQAWPGRGFWQGHVGSQPGTLTGMTQTMAGTSQPHFLSSLVSGFSSVVRGHGFAVNLVAVIALAVIGASFLTGRRDVVRPALAAFLVLCLADWVLIEDFGFLGGLGTDPNSMIPMALLAAGGFVALTRVPAAVTAPAEEPAADLAPGRAGLRGALGRSLRAATFGTMTLVAAFGVIVLGAVPMAAAQAHPGCEPHSRAGHRRRFQPDQHPGPRLHPDRPARVDGHAVQPARQGRAVHLPRSRVRYRLPAHRAGVPPGLPAARHQPGEGRSGRGRRQPAVQRTGLHPAVRPAGRTDRPWPTGTT